MKNKIFIVIVSFLAVLICLIITVMLFYAVPPGFLVVASFAVGVVTGVCILAMIINLRKMISEKRLEKSSVPPF
jgi:uncharacterized membrane protein